MLDPATSTRLLLAADSLDALADQITQSVTRWCYQNSWSSNPVGLAAMADLLQRDFAVLGLPCQRVALPDWESWGDDGQVLRHSTGPALLWHHRPDAARRVLLLIHYDTVYPPEAVPVAVTLTPQGRLLGPGVADAKGGIAVILYALQAILRFDLSGDLGISVLLNPDEELGSPGSRELMRTLASQFEFALVFEPTLSDGSMVANRKGTANFTAVIHGRAAHAGRNLSEGRNAIVHAARLVSEWDAWNQPGSAISVNIGKINGGGPLNQVAHLATVSANIRVTTSAAAAEVISRVRDLEQRYSAVEGFACRIHGQFHCPPKQVDGDARFAELRRSVEAAAAKAHRSLRWQDTGGACDGNKLHAWGCPNIDTMGPTGGELHSHTEYCEAASLVAAAKTLLYLIADRGSR
ncbi:MAG: hydrolase [Planctomycetaceae bacterium]